jgi:hypothetical protein
VKSASTRTHFPEADDPIGVDPGRMRSKAPTTLQEAKPKAGSIHGSLPWIRTADGSEAQKSTPRIERKSPADRLLNAFHPGDRSPRRKSIGADARRKRQVGPARQKCRATHAREQTCEGSKTQERRRANSREESPRPAGPRKSDRRSGTPRQRTRWCMTRSDGTIEAVVLDLAGFIASVTQPASPVSPARCVADAGKSH